MNKLAYRTVSNAYIDKRCLCVRRDEGTRERERQYRQQSNDDATANMMCVRTEDAKYGDLDA